MVRPWCTIIKLKKCTIYVLHGATVEENIEMKPRFHCPVPVKTPDYQKETLLGSEAFYISKSARIFASEFQFH